MFITRTRLYITIHYSLWTVSYSRRHWTDDRPMKSGCLYVWLYVCKHEAAVILSDCRNDPYSETKLRIDFSELCPATSDCKLVDEINKAAGLHSTHIIFFLWIFYIIHFFNKARRFGSPLCFRLQHRYAVRDNMTMSLKGYGSMHRSSSRSETLC